MDADKYGNDDNVELAWAMKAFHHAETYFNLISSVDNRLLTLTKHDDELYNHFKRDFPDMAVDRIKEEDLKSDTAKRKWRPFCNHFDGTITDFNYGTLLRLNTEDDYSEKNSIFVTRVQFFAIEVVRNRDGLNQAIRIKKTAKHKEEEEEVKVQGSADTPDQVTESGDAQPKEGDAATS